METVPTTSGQQRIPWKILLIDDDREDYLIVKELLKDAILHECHLQWASSYHAGLQEMASDAYDAVLVDYDLGARNGILLMQEARQRGYSGPMILYTGKENDDDVRDAIRAGIWLYLTKAETTASLLERVISCAIDRQNIDNQLRAVQQKFEQEREECARLQRAWEESEARWRVTPEGTSQHALANERRFRDLADSMPQLVWTARPDGTVDYYNIRYLEYEGIAPAPDDIWRWEPVVYPDDLDETTHAWQHALETGDMYQVEHRVRMRDGTFRWHLSRGIPVRNEYGAITRWYGTATDIEEQKQNEYQLKRSNKELEEFAFIASHDLQEPLRKIVMFSRILNRSLDGAGDGEARQSLERIVSAAERMRVMVDGLLELSRVTTRGGNFVRVNLNTILADVISMLESRIVSTGSQVTVETLPEVEGDALQLHQLFQNLLANALKFQPPGQTPVVRVYGTVKSNPKEPVVIVIRVEDNGIGFEPEQAERIFQPFLRLSGRNNFEGSGLGLAICQRIVERHMGKIQAIGKPGEGSVFIITLPQFHSQLGA